MACVQTSTSGFGRGRDSRIPTCHPWATPIIALRETHVCQQVCRCEKSVVPKPRRPTRSEAVLFITFLILVGSINDASAGEPSSNSHGGDSNSATGDTNNSSSSFSVGAGAPRLLYLAVRSFSRPVDLYPIFSPTHYIYTAALDYASEHFAVDAIPAPHMEIVDEGSLQTIKVVEAGGSSRVSVTVRDANSQASMEYSVTVKRRDGTDVALKALDVPGATMSPVYAASITEYVVRVPADLDILYLRFAPVDAGQNFLVQSAPPDFSDTFRDATSTTAAPEDAPDSNPNLAPVLPMVQPSQGEGGDSGGSDRKRSLADVGIQSGSRRLDGMTDGGVPALLSGEVQYGVIERWFPIDVGQSRLITVVVTPADGDLSRRRTYRLQTVREQCPQHRPYFAPDVGACAMTCNDGFFPASSASRCEACPDYCLRCSAWDSCTHCEDSVWQSLRLVYNYNGRCRLFEIPWLQVILGVAIATAVLSICTCCVCFCCLDSHRGKARVGPRQLQGRRGEEDALESHRLLEDGSGGDGVSDSGE